ncbi:MAG: rod shape-determining protein MreC [Cytophagales bacterium]|nr:MAG: rod shape-determining protein MreC [Cytophagales bacterium]TAF59400.1 MAG: rod shape-determining protein MreC [Cytophagales bacterium]
MRKLFDFFYKYQLLLVFVLLEGLCFWLIVSKNSYQRVVFFTSTNTVVGYLLTKSAQIQGYFELQNINDRLMAENARLQAGQFNKLAAWQKPDSAFMFKYEFIPAKVVKNSVSLSQNFITIDKGAKDGIRTGDGVVTSEGIVGKVERCSDNYAIVRSVLHNENRVSSIVRAKGTDYMLCTTVWDGRDYRHVFLEYLPQYRSIAKGDTVLTSEYNAVYPEGFLIGVVDEVPTKNSSNPRIRVRLNHDFSLIRYVYVLKNTHSDELKSLEQLP